MLKVLLYSGGMDSWLIDKLWKPNIKLYVDMHTRYSEQEKQQLPSDVRIEDLPLGKWERPDKIIPLRNLYLVMTACNITGSYDVDICIGATSGDRVLDKSHTFVDKANDLLNYLYSPQWWIPQGKKVHINIDYKNYSKEKLLELYLQQGGDIDEAFTKSFSCYEPDKDGNVCWCCKPCVRKFVAFDSVGYKFPDSVLKKVIPYIQHRIKPLIESGVYGRGEEEETAILTALNKYESYCN